MKLLSVLHVLNMHNMPKDASLTRWALLLILVHHIVECSMFKILTPGMDS